MGEKKLFIWWFWVLLYGNGLVVGWDGWGFYDFVVFEDNCNWFGLVLVVIVVLDLVLVGSCVGD